MFNQPKVIDSQGNQTIRRYEHQPLTIDHFGTKCQIHENGKVTITTSTNDPSDKDGVVIDEVKVSASLIFKLAGLLKNTRTVKYVTVSEVKETEE